MAVWTTLQKALQESVLLSEWIGQHYPLQFVEAGHLHIAMTLNAIAGEHREAFMLLLRNDAKSSAFALARCVYEAFMHSLCAEVAMTPERYCIAKQRAQFAKFDSIMSD